MNTKTILPIVLAGLLMMTACSTSGNTTATPQAVTTVIADSTIIAEGRVEPIQYAEVAFNTSGMVGEILVKEGQTVKQGERLIRLGDETDSNYAAAQLELVNAQKAMDDLIKSRDLDFAQATIDLKDAQEAYDRAVDYLQFLKTSKKVPQTNYSVYLVQSPNGYEYRYKADSFKGTASEEWITGAEDDLALKKANLEDAQHRYDSLKEGPDTDELPVLQARVNAVKAKLAAFTVTAPFDSMVAEMNARVGSTISPGQVAVVIADTSRWVVNTTDVTEIDVVKLAEGQEVTVTLDAIPDAKMKGKILAIGQNYSENQGDIVYKVTILLTDPNPAMRWGMTAVVKFEP